MKFEFGEYCFIKWKFEIQHFRSVKALAWSIENGKKIILESQSIKKSIQSIKSNFRLIENCEIGFSAEFSSDWSERLKRFQALLTVLWNILTLHTCLLMKYNPMGIYRGLCSLETQEILWSFSKIAICRTQHLISILGTNLR